MPLLYTSSSPLGRQYGNTGYPLTISVRPSSLTSWSGSSTLERITGYSTALLLGRLFGLIRSFEDLYSGEGWTIRRYKPLRIKYKTHGRDCGHRGFGRQVLSARNILQRIIDRHPSSNAVTSDSNKQPRYTVESLPGSTVIVSPFLAA